MQLQVDTVLSQLRTVEPSLRAADARLADIRGRVFTDFLSSLDTLDRFLDRLCIGGTWSGRLHEELRKIYETFRLCLTSALET